MKPEKLIREYLESGRTKMMQVATADGDQPWICTVYYAVDHDLNLYWISKPTRQHSQEIAKNPKVAAAIAYDQQPPQPYVRGIQVEGTAKLLTGEEAEAAANIYAEQLKSDPKWIEDVINGKDPHRVYKLAPTKYVLLDSKNFPDEARQEWTPQ